ncbi:O-antigen ligase family protein [Psychrobacillus sp. FJAT-51614]|uniref:O-antigen ligase family protein n=1 Tax=Psychrobacillus mangrovi TaxID=3117745 RepID=A0ABU8F1Y5_9BACI
MVLNKSDDQKISIAIMASFVVLTIQYFLLINFNLIGTSNGSIVQLLSKILVGVLFLYALPAVLKRSLLKFIGFYFVASLIFILNYLFFPNNHLYLKGLIFPFFGMCLPALVYTLSLRDLDVFKQVMKKASYLVFFFGALLGLIIVSGNATAGSYSMALSYYMLLPAILFLDSLIDKYSTRALLFSLISIFVILALGSRGALLCIVVFVLLKMVRGIFKLSYTKVFYNLLVIVSLVFLSLNLDKLLNMLYEILNKYDINSRSIELFLSGEVHLSGRDYIYENLVKAVMDNPFFGLGFGADRRIIGKDGGYAHNLFLELVVNFGIVAGGIASIIFLFLLIRSLFIKDINNYHLIIVWISLGFVHLMVSSSYITDIKFWILMGLLIKLNIETGDRLT